MEQTAAMKQGFGRTVQNRKTGAGFGSNPMTRKLSRITERSEEHVTFAGIANKCMYFLLVLFAGVLAAILLQNVGTKISLDSLNIRNFTVALSDVSVTGIAVMGVTGLMALILPFIAFVMRRAAALLGTLYCFSVGYLYSFLALIVKEYRPAIAIAATLTVALCAVLFVLYRFGKIRVTSKFKTVILTLVFTELVFGLVMIVCSFIPALRFIPAFVYSNALVVMGFAILGVIIASLLVLADFDIVTKCVENKIPVENEWYCAFSLAFSVIYLFTKILELVLRIMQNAKKN